MYVTSNSTYGNYARPVVSPERTRSFVVPTRHDQAYPVTSYSAATPAVPVYHHSDSVSSFQAAPPPPSTFSTPRYDAYAPSPAPTSATYGNHHSQTGSYIHPPGLQNLGNSCFLNSVLQCLVATRALWNCLQAPDGYERPVTSAFRTLAQTAREMETSGNSKVLAPRTLFDIVSRALSRTFSARDYRQHDAHECLRYLLDQLGEEMPLARARLVAPEDKGNLRDNDLSEAFWKFYYGHAGSRVTNIFCGQLKSSLQCSKCQAVSRTFDPFFDLSLPIPTSSAVSRGPSLRDCLELFTQAERLQGEESPKCEKCNNRRPATKKLSIFRTPPVLVLHLKRFSESGRKISTEVICPPPNAYLHLSEFIDRSSPFHDASTYSLFAVINHYGSMHGGHYTAVCKHPMNKTWYEFNDSHVRPLPEPSVLTAAAYVLFYERVQ
eukprot:TRINITY_DN7742_c0_g1_i1.p1 TRINITY_DN7742_c0_g1~~TRINITY_DN7742_c0_g1_i1.p1  ORF type:complete len:443 (+),score=35.98 TRINITY_DN7742_c0_g1_i1:24-1331(+)